MVVLSLKWLSINKTVGSINTKAVSCAFSALVLYLITPIQHCLSLCSLWDSIQVNSFLLFCKVPGNFEYWTTQPTFKYEKILKNYPKSCETCFYKNNNIFMSGLRLKTSTSKTILLTSLSNIFRIWDSECAGEWSVSVAQARGEVSASGRSEFCFWPGVAPWVTSGPTVRADRWRVSSSYPTIPTRYQSLSSLRLWRLYSFQGCSSSG